MVQQDEATAVVTRTLKQVRARINFIIDDALKDAIEDVEWCEQQLARDKAQLAMVKKMVAASKRRLEEARAWLLEVKGWELERSRRDE